MLVATAIPTCALAVDKVLAERLIDLHLWQPFVAEAALLPARTAPLHVILAQLLAARRDGRRAVLIVNLLGR